VHPQAEQKESIFRTFCCWAEEIWRMGVAHSVVLYRLLRATTKKRVVNFFEEKSDPRQNAGYAYD